MKINIIGDKEAIATFRSISTAVQTTIQGAILDAAAETAAMIGKEKAPRGATLELSESIEVDGEGTERNIGPTDFKGMFFEYGTGERFHKSGKSVGSIVAQPFMRPALEDPRVKDAATNEFQKQMQGLKLL